MVDGYITARSCAVRVSVIADGFYNSTTTEWHILIERRFEGMSYTTNSQGPGTSHS